MEKMNINALAAEDSIVLYWERPKAVPIGLRYNVYVNGVLAGTTEKTHYEAENLEPDWEYKINICTENGDTAGDAAVLNLKTSAKKTRLDVSKAPYYAVGDGKKKNTQAIQQAIDDCKAGEAVYLPAGVFLTGALRLHSDMELYLEEGAVLLGTDQIEDYLPRIPSRFEGTELECYSSLLNLGFLDRNGGFSCENVTIRGKGTIAGGGWSLAEKIIESEKERLKEYIASLGNRALECEKPETIPGRVRPRLVNLSNCRNVRISGLTLKNGPSWNVHMIYCRHIVTDNCRFFSEGVWNGDGWDPDSSEDCTIFGCDFHTGDDGISVKSGKNPEGNQIGRPCRRIRIFDCVSSFGHGFTIGSEMSGGVEDVAIWDCDLSKSLCGIEIKGTGKRGGYVRNITVQNCRTPRVCFHSVAYNDDGEAALEPPVFENCRFENLRITGEYLNKKGEKKPCDAVELCGFDQPGHELRNIVFCNIRLGSPGNTRRQTISLQLCRNILFDNISNYTIKEETI